MAGKCQTAFVATMIAGLVAAASLAAAQPIPLPPPNPFPRSGNVPPPPPAGTPGRQGQPAVPPPAASGPSWLPPFLGGAPQQPAARAPAATPFDERQRTLVNRVSGYLSSVHVLSGDFVQIGADGRRAKGTFYIQKPGRVRFEYEPPSPIDIIANGRDVVVRDRRLATQDLYPLSQTPLRFLLSDKIDLLRDTNVVAIYADTAFVTVVVEEKQVLLGTSRLMMMFDSKDYQLKQWVITDPQGYDTTVAVSNLDSKSRPDPKMFTIDYTDYSRER